MFNVGCITRNHGWNVENIKFSVVDIETTGLDPRHDRIVEFAVVQLQGTDVLGSASTLIRPPVPVPPGAEAMHGLTSQSLRDAPRFGEVAREILSFLQGSVVVSHNIAFDGAFLAEEFRRCSIELPELPSVCTQITSCAHLISTRRKIGSLFNLLTGNRARNTHHAESDAAATAVILNRLTMHAPENMFYNGKEPTHSLACAAHASSGFVPRKHGSVEPILASISSKSSFVNTDWRKNWAPTEVPAEESWEWTEINAVRGMCTVSPPDRASRVKDWNRRESQGAGNIHELSPERADEVIDMLLLRVRGWRTLKIDRRVELKDILIDSARSANGSISSGFSVAEAEAQKTYVCERDAKHHRIGSVCNTLKWSDENLIAYLERRLTKGNPQARLIESAVQAARSRLDEHEYK